MFQGKGFAGVNVWLFNPFDDLPWEGKPQRYATLARCLADRGHSVVHWSSDFSHRLKEKRAAPGKGVEEALSYRIERVPTRPYAGNISLARVCNHRQYGKRLVSLGRKRVAAGELVPPDLILASMPPIEGPGAALALKKTFGCKVVLDVMDAWPATLLQALPNPGSRSPWRMLNGWVQFAAKAALLPYALQLSSACRKVDAVSAQSKAFADFAHRNGAEGKPTYVCLLGADPAGDETVASRAVATVDPTTQRPLHLLYLGAMGRSYDLATVLDAVERLNSENRGEPKVRLTLVGDGEKRAALESRKVPHVEFTGFLGGQALDARLREADLGLVPFFPESGVAVPYKAGEYLAYGLPLISSIDGELGEIIRSLECGIVYSAEDAEGLADAIFPYITDRKRLVDEQAAAQNCFSELFDRSHSYPHFAEWIERIAESSDKAESE